MFEGFSELSQESVLAPSSSSLSAEVDFDKPRPGFVKGVVVRVFEDGTSFQVKCQLDGQLSGGPEHLVKVRAWKVWSLEKTLLEPCCSVAIVVMVVVVLVDVVVVLVFFFDGTC